MSAACGFNKPQGETILWPLSVELLKLEKLSKQLRALFPWMFRALLSAETALAKLQCAN